MAANQAAIRDWHNNEGTDQPPAMNFPQMEPMDAPVVDDEDQNGGDDAERDEEVKEGNFDFAPEDDEAGSEEDEEPGEDRADPESQMQQIAKEVEEELEKELFEKDDEDAPLVGNVDAEVDGEKSERADEDGPSQDAEAPAPDDKQQGGGDDADAEAGGGGGDDADREDDAPRDGVAEVQNLAGDEAKEPRDERQEEDADKTGDEEVADRGRGGGGERDADVEAGAAPVDGGSPVVAGPPEPVADRKSVV